MGDVTGVMEQFLQRSDQGTAVYLTEPQRRERIAAKILACQQNISPAEAIRRADELIELLDADTSSLNPHPSTLPSSTTPAAVSSPETPGGQALTNPPTGAPTYVDATPRADSAGVEPSPAPSAEAGACQHPNAAPAGAHSPTAGAATWEPTEEQVEAYRDELGYWNELDMRNLMAAYRAVFLPMFQARIAAAQQPADVDPDGDHANEDQKRPAPAMTEAQVLAFHEMAGLLNDLRFQPELTNALWARIDLAHKHALAAMPIGMGVRS